MKETKNRIINRGRRFASVPETIINDPNLSAKAKGLAAYIYFRPDDWTFYMTEIMSHFRDGTDSIRSAFNELINAGYLRKTQIKNTNGQFSGTIFEISDTPFTVDGKTVDGKTVDGKTVDGKTVDGKTVDGKTVDGKTATTYIDRTNIDKTKKDNNNTPYNPPMGESQPKENAFKAPTIEELETYGKSKGFTKTDYVDFWEFYENKGWKVGNVKMKSWQLALNRWERNQKGKVNYGIDKRYNQKDTSNNSGSCNSSSVYSEFEFRDDD